MFSVVFTVLYLQDCIYRAVLIKLYVRLHVSLYFMMGCVDEGKQ